MTFAIGDETSAPKPLKTRFYPEIPRRWTTTTKTFIAKQTSQFSLFLRCILSKYRHVSCIFDIGNNMPVISESFYYYYYYYLLLLFVGKQLFIAVY